MDVSRRRYLATVSAAVGGVALAGCSDDEGDAGAGGADGDGGDGDGGSGDGNGSPDVEILDHEFYQEQFQSGVRGTARNNTDRELGYVEAEAVFLDENGTQIGDGIDNVTDLAAGREWEFECMYLDDDPERIDSYEIEVSTGF